MYISTTIKQHPVVSFIALTLGLSLATFLVPVPKENAFELIAFMLVIIPTVVAFVLVDLIDGRQGLRAFVHDIFNWHVALKWIVIALAVSFTIRLGAGLLALVTGKIATIETGALTPFFIAYFPLALLEEIGWRGLVLRRLLNKHSLFASTLMLGVPWSLLHFVLYVYTTPNVSPVAEMLAVVALAFPLSWIFIKSKQNVLITTVLHGAINGFGIIGVNAPAAEGVWFLVASTWIVAAILLLIDRHIWFTRPVEKMTNHTVLSAA